MVYYKGFIQRRNVEVGAFVGFYERSTLVECDFYHQPPSKPGGCIGGAELSGVEDAGGVDEVNVVAEEAVEGEKEVAESLMVSSTHPEDPTNGCLILLFVCVFILFSIPQVVRRQRPEMMIRTIRNRKV